MNRKSKTNLMVKIALLSAIALVLSLFEVQVPIFPSFLKFDISDIPAVVGAIALGPIPAVIIMFIKNVLNGFIANKNAGVGELANFLIGSCLVLPLGVAIRKNKTSLNFAIGAIAGIIFMIVGASYLNIYVLLPMYAKVGFPIEKVIEMANAVNSNVTDLRAYIIYVVVPFNFIKGVLVMVLGYGIFKYLKKPLLNL